MFHSHIKAYQGVSGGFRRNFCWIEWTPLKSSWTLKTSLKSPETSWIAPETHLKALENLLKVLDSSVTP